MKRYRCALGVIQMTSALIISGGYAKHEPQETGELFAGLLRDAGLQVDQQDTLDVLRDVGHVRKYDLLVPNWSVDTITQEQAEGLSQAVAAGVNLGMWHGGLVTLTGSATAAFVGGGQFVAHPGNIIDYTVDINDNTHLITTGLGNFVVRSEQYYMHVDPSNHVLATTTFSGDHLPWIAGTVMPVAWARQWGAGRVFYCALGHVAAEFDVPQTREIVRRGLLWAVGALE